uniref:Uncharacterized protein n=1 Tax=Yersinia enterocolitica W22703 TaxID=913028 RepID=F4N303_YEREN|nr:unknown protein [Yersinia enterocolitica W22703]
MGMLFIIINYHGLLFVYYLFIIFYLSLDCDFYAILLYF